LGGHLKAFSVPARASNVEFYFKSTQPVDPVSTLFLFKDIPLPCMELLKGAKIVGSLDCLVKFFKGRDEEFYLVAYWRDFVAVEIVN